MDNPREEDSFDKEELEEKVEDGSISKHLYMVFTYHFDSAHVYGRVKEVHDRVLKKQVLRALVHKYSRPYESYFAYLPDSALDYTRIFEVEVDEISRKRHESKK